MTVSEHNTALLEPQVLLALLELVKPCEPTKLEIESPKLEEWQPKPTNHTKTIGHDMRSFIYHDRSL